MSNNEIQELLKRLDRLIRIYSYEAQDTIAHMDADDIAQELRIKVWLHADKFMAGSASPETYANTVFKNAIWHLWRDHTQTQKRKAHVVSIDDEAHGDMTIADMLRENNLYKCFDHDTLYRLLAWECELEGVVY